MGNLKSVSAVQSACRLSLMFSADVLVELADLWSRQEDRALQRAYQRVKGQERGKDKVKKRFSSVSKSV